MKTSTYIGSIALSFLLPTTTYAFDQSSPADSLVVDSSGLVGIGTATPAKGLHITRNDGRAAIRVVESAGSDAKRYLIQLENNGATGTRYTDSSNGVSWQMAQTNSGGFVVSNEAAAGQNFVVNNNGSVYMGPNLTPSFTLSPSGNLAVTGTSTATAHISSSSRTVKKDFSKVNYSKILNKIKDMDVTEWRYKDDLVKGRHIGPMAEDFYSLFNLGPDNKHIAATDMASIALIAAKELQKENTNLRTRLSSLEKLVTQLASSEEAPSKHASKVAR